MSDHTPGPWVFEICEDSGDDFHLHAGEVVIIGGCGCCGSPYVAGDDHLANARLIALAPEMYDYIAAAASNGCANAQRLIAKAGGNDE